MLTLGSLNYCGNQECLVIYMTPKQYEPLMSFCPICRACIMDEVNYLDRLLEEADDDGSSN
jgi:hypothetical protein